MSDRHICGHPRRGITVLGLLLLIIAVVIAAIFLTRYLRSRPAVSWHEPLNELDLSRVIQVVSSDAVYLLGVGPDALGRAPLEIGRR